MIAGASIFCWDHDYGKPLTSVDAGTLSVKDDTESLSFEAQLSLTEGQASWMRDVVNALETDS